MRKTNERHEELCTVLTPSRVLAAKVTCCDTDNPARCYPLSCLASPSCSGNLACCTQAFLVLQPAEHPKVVASCVGFLHKLVDTGLYSRCRAWARCATSRSLLRKMNLAAWLHKLSSLRSKISHCFHDHVKLTEVLHSVHVVRVFTNTRTWKTWPRMRQNTVAWPEGLSGFNPQVGVCQGCQSGSGCTVPPAWKISGVLLLHCSCEQASWKEPTSSRHAAALRTRRRENNLEYAGPHLSASVATYVVDVYSLVLPKFRHDWYRAKRPIEIFQATASAKHKLASVSVLPTCPNIHVSKSSVGAGRGKRGIPSLLETPVPSKPDFLSRMCTFLNGVDQACFS